MNQREGSYTIEAAIILPVLLIIISAIYVFFTAFVLETRMESAIESVGRSCSAYYLAVEKITDSIKEENAADETETEDPTGSGTTPFSADGFEKLLLDAVGSVLWYPVSETIMKTWVLSEVGEDWGKNPLIENGTRGVSFFGTKYDGDMESVIINVNYSLKVPFFRILPVIIPINNKSVHRVWSGKPMEKGEPQEDVVYITETGKAYHTSLNCHYLKLSVTEVPLSHIPSERNEDGSKFYPCELCGTGSGTKVYVTSYGNRYHFERNCSGLKRGIKSVPLSEVGDRTLCKKCAAREKK